MTDYLCSYCRTIVTRRRTPSGKRARRVLDALGMAYTPADCPTCKRTMAVDLRPVRKTA